MNLRYGFCGCLGLVSPDCTKGVGVVVSAVLFSLSVIDRGPFRRSIIAERFLPDIAIVTRERRSAKFVVVFILDAKKIRKVLHFVLATFPGESELVELLAS